MGVHHPCEAMRGGWRAGSETPLGRLGVPPQPPHAPPAPRRGTQARTVTDQTPWARHRGSSSGSRAQCSARGMCDARRRRPAPAPPPAAPPRTPRTGSNPRPCPRTGDRGTLPPIHHLRRAHGYQGAPGRRGMRPMPHHRASGPCCERTRPPLPAHHGVFCRASTQCWCPLHFRAIEAACTPQGQKRSWARMFESFTNNKPIMSAAPALPLAAIKRVMWENQDVGRISKDALAGLCACGGRGYGRLGADPPHSRVCGCAARRSHAARGGAGIRGGQPRSYARALVREGAG